MLYPKDLHILNQDETRRLSAIVFTDMVGYSTIAQSNESLALDLLKKQDLLVRSELGRFRGKEVKTIGDSFLLEFDSTLEAVLCAIRIQQAIMDRNLSVEKSERISLRIGIHVGDVIHRNNDVFGDAVNIASRIVSLAEEGGICLSEQAYTQIRTKIDYEIIELPAQHLRHIEGNLSLYQIVLPWSKINPVVTSRSESQKSIRIAVLPLTNISPDPNDRYFADGLTEELISDLSEVNGLRVIARTTINHYRGSEKSIAQIGSELDVSYIVEGSVRKSGEKVRVSTQLIEVNSQEHVWSNRYDRDLEDIFSIQTEIAKQIAGSLEIKLLKDERTRIEKRDTENPTAYVAYLKGRAILQNQRTEQAIASARKQFELAIKEDPAYARAYAGLADIHMLLGDYLFAPVPFSLEEAKRNIGKALELDPDLPEAHVSLGYFLQYDFKFVESRAEFERAIALNPSYATAHHWYASCLEAFGENDAAFREALLAEELDPLSSSITLSVCYRSIAAGRYDEALNRVKKLQEIDRYSPLVSEALMAYNFAREDWDNTLVYLEKMIKADPSDPFLDGDLAYIYARRGEKEKAREIIRKLEQIPDDARTKGSLIAFVYSALGDLDECFRWLEFAFESREVFFPWVRSYPLFKNVREDIRFPLLLKRAGLPV